jgi:hypothetical protein
MIRVIYKDEEGEWWVDGVGAVKSLGQLDSETREKMTILSLLESGGSIEGVGKRVSRETFWLYDVV